MGLITLFTGISGVNDGGNLIGTYLSSNTIRPIVSISLLLVGILIAPFVFGTSVSHTIAVEIINFVQAGRAIFGLSILAAVLTLAIAWWLSIPTSATMALVGGMVGTVIAAGHVTWIEWSGLTKVVIGLVASVTLGFGIAFAVASGLWVAVRRFPKIGFETGRAQVLTVLFQGLAYGANGEERSIGLMAMFLMIIRGEHHYVVPLIAVAYPFLIWSIGFFSGGLRIAKTISSHVIRLRDTSRVSTQLGAAITVAVAALAGIPVSTTEAIDGSLFGTGAALRPYHVRWHTVRKFLKVWLVTLPIAIGAGTLCMGFSRLMGHL